MRSALSSAAFWMRTAERAVKTGAQSAILAIGQDVTSFDVFQADAKNVVGFAAGGVVLSVLTSLVSLPVGPAKSDPSLV